MLQELKLKFYERMIELGQHDGSYLAVCKHFRAMADTDMIKEDLDKLKEVNQVELNEILQ